jgi:hypothetical protein
MSELAIEIRRRLIGLTDWTGQPYNANSSKSEVDMRCWAIASQSQDLRTKGLNLLRSDSPKFLTGGPSARLQGAKKRLTVERLGL